MTLDDWDRINALLREAAGTESRKSLSSKQEVGICSPISCMQQRAVDHEDTGVDGVGTLKDLIEGVNWVSKQVFTEAWSKLGRQQETHNN